MNEVLNRLRSPASVFYEYAADDGALLKEAAAEIERLQARLDSCGSLLAASTREGVLAVSMAETERLQAHVRGLEAALIPLYDAGHDVIRRVGGDPDAPGHMEMLRALAVALQGARPLADALAAVNAEEDGP